MNNILSKLKCIPEDESYNMFMLLFYVDGAKETEVSPPEGKLLNKNAFTSASTGLEILTNSFWSSRDKPPLIRVSYLVRSVLLISQHHLMDLLFHCFHHVNLFLFFLPKWIGLSPIKEVDSQSRYTHMHLLEK